MSVRPESARLPAPGPGAPRRNGVLNPYNPFAANGQTAQASRSPALADDEFETKGRALRGVVGASGTFFDDWHYNASFTASEFKLRRIQSGYLIPQRIMDVVARGEFNFNNLDDTPDNIWDYISPDSDVSRRRTCGR